MCSNTRVGVGLIWGFIAVELLVVKLGVNLLYPKGAVYMDALPLCNF